MMLCVVGFVVGIISSCAPRSHSGTDRSLEYAYSPASFNVHSLSRLATEPGGPATAVELWIEFLDAEGVTSRGVGLIQASVSIQGRNSVVGALNLDDAQANAQAWDRPLRMYRLIVPLKPPVAETTPASKVEVTWVRPSGVRSVVHTNITTPKG